MDQDTVKLGLLIEAAQTHQRLAEVAIGELNEQAQKVPAVLRAHIERALSDSLKPVQADTQAAIDALRRATRTANARMTLWTLGITAISASIALFVAWCILPTPAEIAALRTEREALTDNIAALIQRGARADVRRCGTEHVCVRVDLKAPRYGENSDYLVIKRQ